MFTHPLTTAAGCAALVFSMAAAAQFVPPPPGSAQGMESGTYGSSIGYDVRGTGSVDRYGRAYDPMNPTDVGTKAAEERARRERLQQRETPEGTDRPADARARGPGTSMNPGLAPGYGSRTAPGVSPNLNPGLGTGTAGPGTAGTSSGRGGTPTTP